MIEAWFRASLTIRSCSPVIVGMTPVLAVNPDWKVRVASRALERREVALELLVERHRPRDRPDRAGAGAEVLDRAEGRVTQPRVMGQPEVVVRGEADQPALVDRDDRPLGATT